MTFFITALDYGAHFAGGYAFLASAGHWTHTLSGSLLGKQSCLTQATSYFGSPQAFQKAGFWGIGGMAWNSIRAVERISKDQYQKPAEKAQDWLLVLTGLATVGCVGLSLFRNSLFQRFTRQGLAFVEDQLVRLTWIQNGIGIASIGVDAWSTKELYQQWEGSDRDLGTGLSLCFQTGMTVFFTFDTLSRQAWSGVGRRLFGLESHVERSGREIGRAIRTSGVENVDQVQNDPFNIAALIGHELGLEDSAVFRVAEHYRGRRKTGDLAVEKAVKRLADDSHAVMGSYHRHAEDLEELDCDELLEVILRHARDRRTPITVEQVREARAVVQSMMVQRWSATELYPLAARDGRRVGGEWEYKLGLPRTQQIEKMVADLEAKGWKCTKTPPTKPRFGKWSKVHPTLDVRFHYQGKEYFIYVRQMSSSNLIYASINGERIEIPLVAKGPSIAPADEILKRFSDNYEGALKWLAAQESRRTGEDADFVHRAMMTAIERGGGESYTFSYIKDDTGLQRWHYDRTAGKVRFDSIVLTDAAGGDIGQELPETFTSFGDAYKHLRKLAETGKLSGRSVEAYTGIQAEKNGVRVSLDIVLEPLDFCELRFHESRAGGLYDELEGSVAHTLMKLGAEGTHNDRSVAAQWHVDVDTPKLSPDPMLRVIRAYHRFRPILEPGMPNHPMRKNFVLRAVQPESPGVSLEQRERDAVREILSTDWDRGPGEKLVPWLSRLGVRMNRLFAVHGSDLNSENILEHLTRRAAEANGTRSWRREHGATPIQARRMVGRLRSKREKPISTEEVRREDTQEEFNPEGQLVFSPSGHLWKKKVWVGLFHAAQLPGALTATPRGRRYHRMMEEALRTYLGT
ncbi:MAG: hypothetical protein HYT76_08845 [Deltaproteobacteria bacterium]|nr:hypothetical protein [Deltaproteobacteria bacterium]